jgi:hypothetical protein
VNWKGYCTGLNLKHQALSGIGAAQFAGLCARARRIGEPRHVLSGRLVQFTTT